MYNKTWVSTIALAASAVVTFGGSALAQNAADPKTSPAVAAPKPWLRDEQLSKFAALTDAELATQTNSFDWAVTSAAARLFALKQEAFGKNSAPTYKELLDTALAAKNYSSQIVRFMAFFSNEAGWKERDIGPALYELAVRVEKEAKTAQEKYGTDSKRAKANYDALFDDLTKVKYDLVMGVKSTKGVER